LHRSLISNFSLKISENFADFYKIFAKFPRILLNFDQILTKNNFRDFSKMQHFSENYWKKRFPRENGQMARKKENGQTGKRNRMPGKG
jgi:hypothetical protein